MPLKLIIDCYNYISESVYKKYIYFAMNTQLAMGYNNTGTLNKETALRGFL